MELTGDTKLREVLDMPCFVQMKGQFIASAMGDWFTERAELTFLQLQEHTPAWNHQDILYGLNRLQESAETGGQYVYDVYSDTECRRELRFRQVKLIYLPAKEKKYTTSAILMAGGAYGAVCTMIESLPVAAKLNELGLDCFCLNYRTATKDSFENGLMPEPIDDLAAAWRYIKKNEVRFGVCAEDYIAGGFSAGGHLSAMWGTAHHGARFYGIPNPKLLLLAYPLITMENQQGSAAAMIGTGLFGKEFGETQIWEYAVNRHVDHGYPAVYLCQSVDDDTVPIKDSCDLEEALAAAGVTYRIERSEGGGHGFGLGTRIPASGWVERAIAFLKDLS